jgi:P27 family predicted phage terminase small subunit
MPNPVALPTKLKSLRGTVRKCREVVPSVAPNHVKRIPPPPKWLTKVQKNIYRDTTQHLKFLNILEVTGLPMVVAYAIEFGNYLEASELRKSEFITTVETKAGTIKTVNPLQRVIDSSLANATKLGALFGLDPVNKGKIKINNEKKVVEGLEEFFS